MEKLIVTDSKFVGCVGLVPRPTCFGLAVKAPRLAFPQLAAKVAVDRLGLGVGYINTL